MSDPSQISEVAGQPAPESRKHGADRRIQELLRDRRQDRERIADLEHQLAELEVVRGDLERWKSELNQMRGAYDEQEKKLPERIAAAREQGLKLFSDFEAVVTGVPLDQQAFRALLASTNGPELMYALGLGFRVIAGMRQRRNQAETDRQQVEYYRQLHRQHFSGV